METAELDQRNRLLFFVAAQKFVAFDGGNHPDGSFVTGFCALNAAEAANADRARKSDLVGKREENFNGRTFLHILAEIEVDPTRADVAGFGAGFPNGRSGRPTDRKWEPHGKTLGGAAFRARQGRTSSNERRV